MNVIFKTSFLIRQNLCRNHEKYLLKIDRLLLENRLKNDLSSIDDASREGIYVI